MVILWSNLLHGDLVTSKITHNKQIVAIKLDLKNRGLYTICFTIVSGKKSLPD